MICFRLLTPCLGMYVLYLYYFRLGVGMIPIWLVLFLTSLGMSFQPIYQFVFSHSVLKGIFILGIAMLMFVEVLILYTGYKTNLKEDTDYIIVLGASVKGENLSLTLHKRVKKAYDYLSLHPDTKAILSGGQGPGEWITEAEAMRRYLVNKGIDETRLILEEKSTSTYENIKFSYEFIETDKKVIVISSRFHLLRSQLIAKKQGFKVKGIGSPTLIYLAPNYYLREFFGVFYEIMR